METNHDLSRGGFQNRDVGRSQFGSDFGPDYGSDFADYSDAPILARLLIDDLIINSARSLLDIDDKGAFGDVELYVHNGFLFLKGSVENDSARMRAEERVDGLPGLMKIINVLSVRYH